MKPVSISLRLAGWYAGISLAGLAVFGVLMWFVLAASLLVWKDRTVQMRAVRMRAVLSAAGGVPLPVLHVRLTELAGSLPEGELIRIVAEPAATQLFAAGNVSGTAALNDVHCSTAQLQTVRVGQEEFRLLCQPVLFANARATLLIPTSLAENKLLLRTFSLALLKTVPLILLVASLGGYLLSRRALRPIDLLIREAQTLTASDLSRRLTVAPPDDQLRRLALEWNSLLGRIESAMIRVTQFTADASHELRSPIAYIRATAEYSLSSPGIDDESRAAFQAIVEEAQAAGDLLETLLTLARPQTPLRPADMERVQVATWIQDVIGHQKPLAASKQQTLVWKRGPACSLLGNRMHLHRALNALVENALKYTPAHGQVTLGYALNSKQELELAVVDTGIGISAQDLPHIFDRFFRVDRARTDASEGIGLGLSLARRLVELHSGTIRVESTPGTGSTFTLVFPAATFACGTASNAE